MCELPDPAEFHREGKISVQGRPLETSLDYYHQYTLQNLPIRLDLRAHVQHRPLVLRILSDGSPRASRNRVESIPPVHRKRLGNDSSSRESQKKNMYSNPCKRVGSSALACQHSPNDIPANESSLEIQHDLVFWQVLFVRLLRIARRALLGMQVIPFFPQFFAARVSLMRVLFHRLRPVPSRLARK